MLREAVLREAVLRKSVLRESVWRGAVLREGPLRVLQGNAHDRAAGPGRHRAPAVLIHEFRDAEFPGDHGLRMRREQRAVRRQ